MLRRLILLFATAANLLALPTLAHAVSLTDQGSSTATETTTGLSSFFNTLWLKAPSWIAAMVVFAFSFIVAKIVKEKVLDRFSEQFSDDDQDILVLIGRTTYVGVLAVGVTIALSIAGIDLTAVIAAVGFGVGFAMQDLIMNFMAGIMILINRQFTIGDFIKVNDTIGRVEEIQSRATILKALDGTRVIVPNADLFTNQVTSYTSNAFRRIEVPVGVEYRTDLSHASQIIREALADHKKVLTDPAPAIVLSEFADSSINFLVRFWVESRSNWIRTKSEVIQLIKQHFDAEGIGIPFPIRTLVFDKDTEDVVMPTYALPAAEMQSHRDQRSKEESELSHRIASAAERASGKPKAATKSVWEQAPVKPAAPVATPAPATTPKVNPTPATPAPPPASPTPQTPAATAPAAPPAASPPPAATNPAPPTTPPANAQPPISTPTPPAPPSAKPQQPAAAAVPPGDTETGANFLQAQG